MRLVTKDELEKISVARLGREVLQLQWLQGPTGGADLDVGVVTVLAGGATPLHVHVGGQVLVGTEGRGFVETDGERIEIAPGDVVICPPGEGHIHGALAESDFAHLSVTAGGYRLPESP